jgi:hypothetical protein
MKNQDGNNEEEATQNTRWSQNNLHGGVIGNAIPGEHCCTDTMSYVVTHAGA